MAIQDDEIESFQLPDYVEEYCKHRPITDSLRDTLYDLRDSVERLEKIDDLIQHETAVCNGIKSEVIRIVKQALKQQQAKVKGNG